MFRKFIAAFVTILFAATIHATAFAEEKKIVSFNGVTVEYPTDFHSGVANKDGVLFAAAFGAPPKNLDKNDTFTKTFARQAARMWALRYLAEALGGVHIESKVNIVELETVQDHIKSKLSQDNEAFKLLEKNARQVGNAEFDEEGVCFLFMAIRIEPRK